MTDQVRAALEALLSQWDAEAGAMPDSRVRTVLQSCAMEVRAILLDPIIARAALAAASPEPERLGDPTCPETHVDGRCIRCGDLTQPAPAAPTVEALRAELVAKLTSDWDMDPYGMYEIARADLLSDIDALVAAVRVDERTRLSGETPSRIHLLGMLASMEWVQPTSNSSPSCPWCGSQKHFGHNPGCSLEAAARADERTRLESLTVEAGPEPKHMPVICCRWHALAQANP